MTSPYESALDLDGLDPRLRAYFGEIPAGSVGVGRGVFDVVGTPKRWLWPVLWVLGRQGVVFPIWSRDVPFTVVNRPDAGSLHGIRTFHFTRGDRAMVDSISPELVDSLGTRGQYRAALRGAVEGGALHLWSTSLTFRGIRLPGRVDVTERSDGSLQHVAVTITAPVVGRVYEYSGHFSYEIMEHNVLTP